MSKSQNEIEIHAMTVAEAQRQIAIHTERRRQIIAERATLYQNMQRDGYSSDTPVLSEDERTSREIARSILNGNAPALGAAAHDFARS